MDRHGSLEKIIALGGMLILLSLVYFVMRASHVRGMLIVGWLAACALALLSLGGFVGWIDKVVSKYLFISACALALLSILGSFGIVQQIVPYCGDDVCTSGECRSGCARDCTAQQCQDKVCTLAIENCASSADCTCAAGLACAPQRNTSNTWGCTPVQCGDQYCDAPMEDRQSCCTDCGCQKDFACEQNICYFQPPRITYTSYIAAPELGATSLAANPSLTTASGEMHPLMAIELTNRISQASDLTVTFTLANILKETITVGTPAMDTSVPVLWYPRIGALQQAQLLNISQDLHTNITVTISYTDTQNISRTTSWPYPLTLRSRDTLDRFGSIVFFVTPKDVDTTGTTPERIWEEVGKRITLASESDGITFPAITLARGMGSSDDIAIVLASAMHSAGLRTSLVETERGFFVRVLDRDEFVMLDPSRIGEAYKNALTIQPGYAVYELDQTWRARNATQLSLESLQP